MLGNKMDNLVDEALYLRVVDVVLEEGEQFWDDFLLLDQEIAISEVVLHDVPQDQQCLLHGIEVVALHHDSQQVINEEFFRDAGVATVEVVVKDLECQNLFVGAVIDGLEERIERLSGVLLLAPYNFFLFRL